MFHMERPELEVPQPANDPAPIFVTLPFPLRNEADDERAMEQEHAA